MSATLEKALSAPDLDYELLLPIDLFVVKIIL